jgi:hypothetical protein
MCLQIAVAETEKAIESAWFWIENNLMPELETIRHPMEKEEWVSEKINMLVSTIGKKKKKNKKKTFIWYQLTRVLESGTDELSSDKNIRNASRTFRQIFDIPTSERFVNCKCG